MHFVYTSKCFLKRRVYLACAWANEDRNLQTVESCSDIQCMSVRVLDISPSSSLLRSLFLSRVLSSCFHFSLKLFILWIYNVFLGFTFI